MSPKRGSVVRKARTRKIASIRSPRACSIASAASSRIVERALAHHAVDGERRAARRSGRATSSGTLGIAAPRSWASSAMGVARMARLAALDRDIHGLALHSMRVRACAARAIRSGAREDEIDAARETCRFCPLLGRNGRRRRRSDADHASPSMPGPSGERPLAGRRGTSTCRISVVERSGYSAPSPCAEFSSAIEASRRDRRRARCGSRRDRIGSGAPAWKASHAATAGSASRLASSQTACRESAERQRARAAALPQAGAAASAAVIQPSCKMRRRRRATTSMTARKCACASKTGLAAKPVMWSAVLVAC